MQKQKLFPNKKLPSGATNTERERNKGMIYPKIQIKYIMPSEKCQGGNAAYGKTEKRNAQSQKRHL